MNTRRAQSGSNAPCSAGWHFLQIPAPSNTPERTPQAIAPPTIDHRGPEFTELMLIGTLGGAELGLRDLHIPIKASDVGATLDFLTRRV